MSKIEKFAVLIKGTYRTQQVFTLLALLSLLAGCSKTENPDKALLLKGTWMNTHVNEIDVETNHKFVLEFTDKTEFYSVGVVFDSLNKKWIDRTAYDYSLSGDRIEISGTDVQGNSMEIVLGIISVSNSELIYRVNFFKVNETELPDDKIYKFKRATIQWDEEIIGTWYGKATNAGNADTDFHYWNYLPDGSYEYYFREDSTSMEWIKKNDNEGRYYLYDNLLATNWSNDIFSVNPGLSYECWEVEITGDVMKWTGYRENGNVATYEIERVSGPPVKF